LRSTDKKKSAYSSGKHPVFLSKSKYGKRRSEKPEEAVIRERCYHIGKIIGTVGEKRINLSPEDLRAHGQEREWRARYQAQKKKQDDQRFNKGDRLEGTRQGVARQEGNSLRKEKSKLSS